MSRLRPMIGLVLAALCALAPSALHAQTPQPTPGPVNPNPPTTAGEGKTIVINPTMEECKRGWVPNSQWTKDQFDKFCTQINVSK